MTSWCARGSPEPAELSRLKLRRDPKVTASIRVVAIGDFDFSPCGGTHCARTSNIGAIRIAASERYKGMTRVTFHGRTSRPDRSVRARSGPAQPPGAQLSCGPAEAAATIDKLRRDGDARAAEDHVAAQAASRTSSSHRSPVAAVLIASIPGDAELVRAVAAKARRRRPRTRSSPHPTTRAPPS